MTGCLHFVQHYLVCMPANAEVCSAACSMRAVTKPRTADQSLWHVTVLPIGITEGLRLAVCLMCKPSTLLLRHRLQLCVHDRVCAALLTRYGETATVSVVYAQPSNQCENDNQNLQSCDFVTSTIPALSASSATQDRLPPAIGYHQKCTFHH